ncbi:hypothetical protein Pint_17636 [Pistacia integerrima]|uniref:Uncharacterized protein n=1 Tax=Pistacia integerrima TaxID=434235 RepID=A0ACC0Z076_9ROSI|nr:hypothetical protein Pint_17636 [Pistacia integerrima]
MERQRTNRRVQIDESRPAKYDTVDEGDDNSMRMRPSQNNVTESQEPFMGVKVRRKASLHREYKGDYIDVPSRPYLIKIMEKQGDTQVLFADNVLKFTAVEKMSLSELSDNFFAIVIPYEYDLLMASTRKSEIVTVLVEATKSDSAQLEVVFSNRFEYNATSDLVKEVQFEEVEGGVKTRILTR